MPFSPVDFPALNAGKATAEGMTPRDCRLSGEPSRQCPALGTTAQPCTPAPNPRHQRTTLGHHRSTLAPAHNPRRQRTAVGTTVQSGIIRDTAPPPPTRAPTAQPGATIPPRGLRPQRREGRDGPLTLPAFRPSAYPPAPGPPGGFPPQTRAENPLRVSPGVFRHRGTSRCHIVPVE